MKSIRTSSPIGWGLLAILTGLAGLWGLANQGSGDSTGSDLGLTSRREPSTSSSTPAGPAVDGTSSSTGARRPSSTTGATATTATTAVPVPAGAGTAELARALRALCDAEPPVRLIALGNLASPAEIRAAATQRLATVDAHLDALGDLAFPRDVEPARAEMRSHLEAARALLLANTEWPDGPALEAGSEPFVRASTADGELGRYGVAAGLLGAGNCAVAST